MFGNSAPSFGRLVYLDDQIRHLISRVELESDLLSTTVEETLSTGRLKNRLQDPNKFHGCGVNLVEGSYTLADDKLCRLEERLLTREPGLAGEMTEEGNPRIDYDSLPLTPTCLVPYAHQIGGHGTGHSSDAKDALLLQHPSTNMIFKPLQNGSRGLREADFYLRVFAPDAPPSLVDLRPFLPTFHGLYRSSAGVVYLALEDVLAGLQNPSVCDLKMGTAGCPPDVDAAKIRSENAKYAHRAAVGFLLTGMKVYDAERGEHLSVSRYFGRELDLEAVYSSGIRVFLGPNVGRHPELARAFLPHLQRLQQVISSQSSFSLYCSSLLLAYQSSRLPPPPTKVEHVVVKLVDFAHYRSRLESSPDDLSGFAHGLDTLIRLLDEASRDSSQLCDPNPLSAI